MVVGFNPGLIGSSAGTFNNTMDTLNARNPGPVMEYKYKNAKPKKQLKEKKAFLCPVQEDKTDNCGTCGLCWTSSKNVVFLTH